MKRRGVRVLAVLLAVCVLLVSSVFAEEGALTGAQDETQVLELTEPVADAQDEEISADVSEEVLTKAVEPTYAPTFDPTQTPTATPACDPTQTPTATPACDPTQTPTATPACDPTQTPTATPACDPTQIPTATPTSESTQAPTPTPEWTPTLEPTQAVTPEPTPCEHKHKDWLGERFDGTYSHVTEESHKAVGAIMDIYQCEDCGYEWEELSYSVNRIEGHELKNGACVCGYTIVCEHENVCTVVYRGKEQYSNITDEGHTTHVETYEEPVCLDCGKTWDEEEPVEEEFQEAHDFHGGRCKCGYGNECAHENVEENLWQNNVEYTNPTEEGHTVSYNLVVESRCKDCGKYWEEKVAERTEYQEEHRFYSGICYYCDYELDCKHEHIEEREEYVDEQYSNPTAEGHTVSALIRKVRECQDCNKILVDETSSERVEFQSTHYFEQQDECEDCGYTNSCEHKNASVADVYYYGDESIISDVTPETHTIIVRIIKHYRCQDCGACWDVSPVKYVTLVYPHDFWDGECYDCGYKASCDHKNFVEDSVGYWKEIYSNPTAEGHTICGYAFKRYSCPDCGNFWASNPEKVRTESQEPHLFYDGECLDCGYVNTCEHKNVTITSDFGDSLESADLIDAVYLNPTAEGHTVRGTLWTLYTCQDCGEQRVEGSEDYVTKEEPHDLRNGLCWKCGYVQTTVTPGPTETPSPKPTESLEPEPTATPSPKPTEALEPVVTETPTAIPTAEPTADPTEEPTAVPTAEPTAVPTAEPTAVPTAEPTAEPTAVPTEEPTAVPTAEPTAVPSAEPTAVPTAEPTAVPTEEPTAVPSAEPTAAPTEKPTAKPAENPTEQPAADEASEPVYEEIPVTEVVHGVKAEDALKIAETAITVAEALEQDGATMVIVNIEKFLTPEEKTALDQLSMKEQLLTVLSVIGYEEQVNHTLEARQETLSDAALALKEQIQTRLAALSEEEKTALMEKFPTETVTVDGVEQTLFMLDLEVSEDGKVRYERYTFCQDGEDWLFTLLEIAE